MPDMRLPVNPHSLEIESAQACELACLNNCSCMAYAYDGGCSVWEGDLLTLQQFSQSDSGGGNLFLKLSASELSSSGSKKGSLIDATVGVILGVVLLLGSVISLFWWWWRRNVFGPLNQTGGFFVQFSYRNLQIATKNFSTQIGSGGFGCVFIGTLPDSTVVAVKKLFEGLNRGEKQFRSEVSTIGMIQHINLIRLHGKDLEISDWKTRYQIACGTARGLTYLHQKCRDCIIHFDIKPENLDPEFCPKVADFGMAKLVGREFSRVLTIMRGTIGYLAPEWISGAAITAKADVYSYGMMLFELISGRRNSDL
ncbi:G-type lectin S-receptor-like serine/threonine-protein kinase At2g19130 [Macadamia integrifolia]|uniref:G-type lectin S-receptor-like serine/threonine-protein kinase At2g19130 n=1 Tax=Macadamia integrifolia TaxID=60698 RepID=UPI001C4F621F|nr:G-type lectin S-receptor-like serine/threonine-protein kinase At2g19130 [Macadamia integrifolia]